MHAQSFPFCGCYSLILIALSRNFFFSSFFSQILHCCGLGGSLGTTALFRSWIAHNSRAPTNFQALAYLLTSFHWLMNTYNPTGYSLDVEHVLRRRPQRVFGPSVEVSRFQGLPANRATAQVILAWGSVFHLLLHLKNRNQLYSRIRSINISAKTLSGIYPTPAALKP